MPFPIDMKYIVEAEQELGLVFPDDFKKKMSQENGGEIITDDDYWQLFPFFDKSDNKRISRTCNHILLETSEAKTNDSFPQNGVSIAKNECGDNLILLPYDSSSNRLREEIYMWIHETSEIVEIAKSIDELIE